MDAPAVAVDPTGKTFAASWMDCSTRPGDNDVFWTVGGKRVAPLATNPKGDQGHTTLVWDGDGVFWAAWVDGRTGSAQIRVSRTGKKAIVDAPLSDPKVDVGASFPRLAAGNGSVIVVYETQRKEVILRSLRDH